MTKIYIQKNSHSTTHTVCAMLLHDKLTNEPYYYYYFLFVGEKLKCKFDFFIALCGFATRWLYKDERRAR